MYFLISLWYSFASWSTFALIFQNQIQLQIQCIFETSSVLRLFQSCVGKLTKDICLIIFELRWFKVPALFSLFQVGNIRKYSFFMLYILFMGYSEAFVTRYGYFSIIVFMWFSLFWAAGYEVLAGEWLIKGNFNSLLKAFLGILEYKKKKRWPVPEPPLSLRITFLYFWFLIN